MTKIRVPKSLEQATELLKRVALVDQDIAIVEAIRQSTVSIANTTADEALVPKLAERAALEAALAPWWTSAAPGLTEGKRKSIELGGCKVGTRLATEKVEFAGGDDKAALAAVTGSALRAAVTDIRRVLNKKAIAAKLKGKTKARDALLALGFSLAGGEDVFFVTRADSADAKVSAR